MEDLEDEDSSSHEVFQKFDALQVIEMLSAAWKMVKPETIVNCWRRISFGKAGEEINEATLAIPVPEEIL